MAAKSNALINALQEVVRMHPRLSAGLAFQLGLMAGAFVKTARGPRGLSGATAKLIEAAPLGPQTGPLRQTRKRAPARKRKPARKIRAAS